MQKKGNQVAGIFAYEQYIFDDPLELDDAIIIVDICRNFGTIDHVIVRNSESGPEAYNAYITDTDGFANGCHPIPEDEYISSVGFTLLRADGSCSITILYDLNSICFRHFKGQDLGIDQFAVYLEKELKKRKKASR